MRIDSNLVMPIDHPEAQRLMDKMTRINPKYAEAVKNDFSTYNIPRDYKNYSIDGSEVLLPRYCYHDLDWSVKNQVEDATYVSPRTPLSASSIKLRDYQPEPVKNIVETLVADYGVVLNALMGTGKTVVSLEVARRMQQKTLIIVHTEFLMTQWVERAEEFLGITPGIIQGDKCEVDRPMVIAMMQTLHARKEEYAHIFTDLFGFVIVDETHKAAAPVFSSVIQQFNARYRLGVSGTVNRKDGLQWVFFSHIGGPKVHMERSADYKVNPVVYKVRGPVLNIPASEIYARGKISNSKFLTALGQHEVRNNFLAEQIADAAEKGRRIIVFSDRKEQLNLLNDLLIKKCAARGVPVSTGFMIGGMKEADRMESQTKQVIFCTFQLAQEGLDIPELDAAFLATPKTSIQQAVGRVERRLEGKKDPIVFDLVDGGSYANSLYKKRERYYHSRGFKIQY